MDGLKNTFKTTVLLAVLGATFPPFVFYWQGAHRLEEMRADAVGDDEAVSLRL